MILNNRIFLAFASSLFISTVSVYADERAVVTGQHFRVICDFGHKRVAEAALETAEAVWPYAVKLRGSQAPPTSPLKIYLFRHVADYEKADARLTGGRCRKNLAFSSWETKSSYIAIQPPCSQKTLAKVGLPMLTRYQIAHEAAHIAVYDAVSNYRSHPDWLSEGGASWVAEVTMVGQGWSLGLEHDPYLGADIRRVKSLLDRGRLPSVHRIFRDDCGDLRHYERYAAYWLFFRFMMSGVYKGKFEGVLDQSRRLNGASYGKKLFTFVERTFGREGLSEIDEAFRQFVQALSPSWWEEVRSLDVQDQTWTQLAFPTRDAVAWRTRPVEKKAYSILGALEILPNPKQRMNVLLGKDGRSFIAVTFIAGFGVEVSRYDGLIDRQERLARQKVPGMRVGSEFRFKVSLDRDRLKVFVNSHAIIHVDLDGQIHTGRWGLGALAGSAGRWRGVRLIDIP